MDFFHTTEMACSLGDWQSINQKCISASTSVLVTELLTKKRTNWTLREVLGELLCYNGIFFTYVPVKLPFIWCWNSDCWAEFGPCKNLEDGIRAPGSTIKHLFQSGAINDGLSNCSMWSASYIEVNALFLLHFLVEQAIESDHDEELKNDHVTAWVDSHSQDTLLGPVKLVQSSNPVQRFFKRYCYSLFHKSSAVEKIETFLHHTTFMKRNDYWKLKFSFNMFQRGELENETPPPQYTKFKQKADSWWQVETDRTYINSTFCIVERRSQLGPIPGLANPREEALGRAKAWNQP
jgi:hypothetical protein